MSENLPEPDAAHIEPASEPGAADEPAKSGTDPVEAVPLTAAEQAVPSFEVPAPPTFDSGVKNVADASAPAVLDAEPVIPPAPEFGQVADAIADAASPRTRRAASQWVSGSDAPPERRVPASASPASAPAVWHVDMAPSSTPGVAESNSYRGWTVAIFGGLAVLLLAAVGLMVFLGTTG